MNWKYFLIRKKVGKEKNEDEDSETKEKCAKHFVFVKTSSRSSTAAKKKKSDLDEVA